MKKTKGLSLADQKSFYAIGAFLENDWAGIARITGEDFFTDKCGVAPDMTWISNKHPRWVIEEDLIGYLIPYFFRLKSSESLMFCI